MKEKSSLILKIILLLIILIIPWTINPSTSKELVSITSSNLSLLQSKTCDFSIAESIFKNQNNDYILSYNKSGSINCFSRISGADLIKNKLVIYLGTNLNLDIIIQSSFWLILLTIIPKTNDYKIKYKFLKILLLTSLVYIHLISEVDYYNINSKIFSIDLNDNYLMYSLLLTTSMIFYSMFLIVRNRVTNLLHYLPYTFVFVGSFFSINLNFFLLLIMLLGIENLFSNKKLFKILLPYLCLMLYWINKSSSGYIQYFDIDKLQGFSSSSYNTYSIAFWTIVSFLIILGINFLIKESKDAFNFEYFVKNMLKTSVLVLIFSYISTVNTISNFYTYYYLGLNKPGSKSIESVAGNAWRGVSSSAESIGEFYALALLFLFYFAFYKKTLIIKFSDYILILLTLFGLYRSNNFAASILLIISLLTLLIFKYVRNNKLRILTFVILTTTFPLIYYLNFNNYQIEQASRLMIREGLEVSFLGKLNTNEIGKTAIEENRFLELLENSESKENVSSGLYYLIEKYHYSARNNIPNITSLISTVAAPINRSEKWGIFFAKYNPSIDTFIFGTSPNNLVSYYLSHPTKVNSGLVLPHSSLFSYLIFIGVFGISFSILFIMSKIIKNKNNIFFIILLMFVSVNLIKSDSLLYFNSFILYVFLLNSDNLLKIEKNKFNVE